MNQENRKSELVAKIENLKHEIESFDPYEHCTESEYEEMLDEVYGEVEICGMNYSASWALKQIDPVAFRVGFSDWAAQRESTEFDEYNDMVSQLEEWEGELADLESELEEIEEAKQEG